MNRITNSVFCFYKKRGFVLRRSRNAVRQRSYHLYTSGGEHSSSVGFQRPTRTRVNRVHTYEYSSRESPEIIPNPDRVFTRFFFSSKTVTVYGSNTHEITTNPCRPRDEIYVRPKSAVIFFY